MIYLICPRRECFGDGGNASGTLKISVAEEGRTFSHLLHTHKLARTDISGIFAR